MSGQRSMQVNIEINAHCNYRCRFCPVSEHPKPARCMSNEDFEKVLEGLCSQMTCPPQWVALNHYGEPLLDPGLLDKAKSLAEKHWPLRLFTNASMLNLETALQIYHLGNLEGFIINLPSLDPEVYKAKTGHKLYRALANIDAIIKAHLPFCICINGTPDHLDEVNEVATAVVARWGEEVEAFANLTHSRAGVVDSADVASVSPWEAEKLPGCSLFEMQLNVAVDGIMFMCCQDYFQAYSYGNILFDPPEKLWDKRRELRRIVFGEEPAPADMICRRCIKLTRTP